MSGEISCASDADSASPGPTSSRCGSSPGAWALAASRISRTRTSTAGAGRCVESPEPAWPSALGAGAGASTWAVRRPSGRDSARALVGSSRGSVVADRKGWRRISMQASSSLASRMLKLHEIRRLRARHTYSAFMSTCFVGDSRRGLGLPLLSGLGREPSTLRNIGRADVRLDQPQAVASAGRHRKWVAAPRNTG
jgi:hypothetical protein